jgi:hypothetical protein
MALALRQLLQFRRRVPTGNPLGERSELLLVSEQVARVEQLGKYYGGVRDPGQQCDRLSNIGFNRPESGPELQESDPHGSPLGKPIAGIERIMMENYNKMVIKLKSLIPESLTFARRSVA